MASGDRLRISNGIKSVQRGIYSNEIDKETIEISISEVDVSRSFINLTFFMSYGGSTGVISRGNNVFASFKNNYTLTLTNDSSGKWFTNYGSISWEVIEFY